MPRAPGGQFVLHARTLPGNRYDGHTLVPVIEVTECLTGREPHQPRAQTALRNRGGDRAYEGRRSSRPLLSQRPRLRCCALDKRTTSQNKLPDHNTTRANADHARPKEGGMVWTKRVGWPHGASLLSHLYQYCVSCPCNR